MGSGATLLAAVTVTVAVAAIRFHAWVRDYPAVREYVSSRVSQHVVDLMALVEDAAFGRMDQRFAELLLRRARAAGSASAVCGANKLGADGPVA